MSRYANAEFSAREAPGDPALAPRLLASRAMHLPPGLLPILLLIGSNLFMTYAWYGHLRDLRTQPLALAIGVSWGIAFFEYCLQVPANRLGAGIYTLPQLKILQEIITMIIFAGFLVFYMRQRLTWDYLWATCCLVGAAYFMFRKVVV